ncbi:VOC family protein [Sphaerobacter thermophilus]|uniref:Glyoxalase/bleomycin resistance protein/dioxygenase n=1 Tax=Sphaerobacter thermophilus (strain ATCC 49802 / DSM 20745 / KCCM 41009 / NCIMB 13125 / S 6022) TaxID=479434 RepID=D1C786_SPHTD|nr:VOC family protein [Sphaerobacter thermophilus]ACZ39732.1 Glyoxalase/bleomycin resistance protein/dioxygenase [Sphaerobacter thermophilus DSM 20745]
MAATGLNHVSVMARNLVESARFYEELFGMERIPTPNFGFPVQWLRVGTLQLHLFERPGDAPTYHHVGLTVDDFAAVYRKAKELGILDRTTFGHHLYELPGNNAQMYLRDPAGNLIEVDYPDVSDLPDDVRADMRRLADKHPQSEENLRATLFLR